MALVLAAAAAGVWAAYRNAADGADADDADDRPIVAPLRIVHEDGKVFVVLKRDEMQKAGIATTMAEPAVLARQVTSFGTVVDPSEIIDAVSAMRSAKAQMAAADAKAAASTAAWLRAKALYADGKSLSTAQMQLAEEAYRSDQAAKAETAAKVAAVGEAQRQAWGRALAKSIAGANGMAPAVVGGTQVLIRIPMPVSPPPGAVGVEWDDGKTAEARLVAELPKADPRFQQRLVLYGAPAASGPPPGITVRVKLSDGAAVQGVKVPAGAVVWWDGSAWVYAQTDEGKTDRGNTGEDRFTRVRVADPGVLPDGAVFVADGPENRPIVSQGAQALLSEESRDRIQVGEEGRSK